MLLIKKSGSGDDCSLYIKIAKDGVVFFSSSYCRSNFIQAEIENFADFLVNALNLNKQGNFLLKLGEDVESDSSHCPIIIVERQRTGKFLLKITISQKVGSFSTRIYDQCTVYLGTDIVSLDEFVKKLLLFNVRHEFSAILETITPAEVI